MKMYLPISPENPKQVYTIGYEGRTPQEFLDILRRKRVKCLVDVRRRPFSRKDGFSWNKLGVLLAKCDIAYLNAIQLGMPDNLLDEYRKGTPLSDILKKYREYLQTVEIRWLTVLCKKTTVAIMCYERDWRKCHRQVIAEMLKRKGFNIEHL